MDIELVDNLPVSERGMRNPVLDSEREVIKTVTAASTKKKPEVRFIVNFDGENFVKNTKKGKKTFSPERFRKILSIEAPTFRARFREVNGTLYCTVLPRDDSE